MAGGMVPGAAAPLGSPFLFWQAATNITGQNNEMSGSLLLREYPAELVRLSCQKCGRAGQYRKQNLIARFGPDIRLPDLREEIAQCERHRKMHDACMVHYVDLMPAN
jgi:hypothetical protein